MPEVIENARYATFRHDMDRAGYCVKEYNGKNFYTGPAVFVEADDLQEVIRATTVRLQTDQMGKSGIVVYPVP